jgi:hypothetical protein
VIGFADWHPAQALMSAYPTVLHLHKLESSTPDGPTYVYPGDRGLMVNAAKEMRHQGTPMQDKTTSKRLTAPVARSHHVPCNRTRILVETIV